MPAKKTKDSEGRCVLTLPLITEPWQDHIIEKRFKIMEHLKNSLIRYEMNKLQRIKRSREYLALEAEIEETPKEKRKPLYNRKWTLLREGGFTEYDFKDDMTPMQKHFVEHIATQIAHKAASDVWRGFNDMLNGKGEVRFIKRGTLDSVSNQQWNTGMRFEDGFFYWNGGQSKNKIVLKIKVTDPRTDYERKMLEKEGKLLRIVRKWMKTRYKYYLQITLVGDPVSKNRERGKGPVGIDIGTQTVAICMKKEVDLLELADRLGADYLKKFYTKKRALQRKEDVSKRENNPELFNPDGTIKEAAKGKRLRWKKSKRYLKLQGQVRELERKNADIRKYQHICLANRIVGMGSEVYVEKMNYAALQHRAKNASVRKDGRCGKKKRFGKSLANKAPSMFLSILKRKMGEAWYHEVDTQSFRASQLDHTDGTYWKKKLREREARLSNGDRIQRDLYSAFLLMNSQTDGKQADLGKCRKAYKAFKKLHDEKMEYMSKQNKRYPSSTGIRNWQVRTVSEH